MKYSLILFFSFVIFVSSFLFIKTVKADEQGGWCELQGEVDVSKKYCVWVSDLTECNAKGGGFHGLLNTCEPASGAASDGSNGASPADSSAKTGGSFKDIGKKLGNVSKGFYGDVAPKSFEETIGGYIKTGLALVGVIFLLLMVYGGYTWMIARGDETEATKAKDTITMASIGMAVVLIAYVITYFILSYALGSVGL